MTQVSRQNPTHVSRLGSCDLGHVQHVYNFHPQVCPTDVWLGVSVCLFMNAITHLQKLPHAKALKQSLPVQLAAGARGTHRCHQPPRRRRVANAAHE
jgi:hypothetical protein